MTSDTWITPKKAAQELKRRNPSSMIGEKLIRGICDNGFPHLKRGNRKYINVDTFNEDLIEYSRREIKPIDYSQIRKNYNNSPVCTNITEDALQGFGKIRRIIV